jgi:hypothetical protein
MDLSQLKSLGEIAGIGGIALGVVVLLGRPLIASIAGLPKEARAGTVRLIAIGCFAIGVLGIAAWTISSQSGGQQVTTRGTQSPGIISGGDATINYGASPATQPGPPPAAAPSSPAPSGTVRTEGGQSPGIIAGGKVGIEFAPASPAPSPPSPSR